jgi:hypothetical protein
MEHRLMEARNDSTSQEALGVIGPLVRCATHIGWCIGYLGSIESEELAPEQQSIIQNDLNDALAHVDTTTFSNLLDAFVGDPGLEQMRLVREDLQDVMPHLREDMSNHLQTLADNTAQAAAIIERLMTGNADATAGRNL